MNKRIKGIFTVEAAVLVPMILVVLWLLMQVLFYYHDKNIVLGVAHETLAVGAGREDWEEKEMEAYFYSRIEGKLTLFSDIQAEVQIEKKQIQLTCSGRKGMFAICTEQVMSNTQPESYIREVKRLIKIQGEGGQK